MPRLQSSHLKAAHFPSPKRCQALPWVHKEEQFSPVQASGSPHSFTPVLERAWSRRQRETSRAIAASTMTTDEAQQRAVACNQPPAILSYLGVHSVGLQRGFGERHTPLNFSSALIIAEHHEEKGPLCDSTANYSPGNLESQLQQILLFPKRKICFKLNYSLSLPTIL